MNSGGLFVFNVSGSATGTDNAMDNDGGTLGGTGLISAAVTVNSSGHVASIQSLAAGSLILNIGSILSFFLGAPGSPGATSNLINVIASGGLTLNGGSVALTDEGGVAVDTYTLIDYAGTVGGAVANLGTPTGPAGFTYALSNNSNNTSIDLTVSAAGLSGGDNHNGVVDAADYVVWRKSDGPQAGYDTWRANFDAMPGAGSGAATPSAGALSPAVPEPEPATLVSLMFATAGWRPRRRRTA